MARFSYSGSYYIRSITKSALAAFALALLAGCGTGAESTASPTSDNGTVRAADSGFTLRVLDDSYYGGGTIGDLALGVTNGEDVTVAVEAAHASGLKAFYFKLDYDAERFTPLTAEATETLAPDRLQLAVLDNPGTVEHGQILIHPQSRAGFSGAGELARITFARRPFFGSRAVSTPPLAEQSQALLALDSDAATLSWGYYSQGDYNQDREVGINDITPLGVHFNESVPADPNNLLAVIDGKADGLLTIADLTPIGVNFGRVVSEWRVYEDNSLASYPASPGAVSSLTPIGTLAFAEYNGAPLAGRLQYNFILTTPVQDHFYWVRPSDGTTEGTASTTGQYTSPNQPPLADVQADPTFGGVPLDVDFDGSASSDSDGTVVNYEWDWEGDGTFDFDSDGDATVSHTYSVAGVYQPVLRVTDNRGGSATASVTVAPSDGGANLLPTAALNANPTSGEPPVNVDFDASGSSDPDGIIILYEWDWEGDGTFDANTGTIATVSHSYSTPGGYGPTVRVTDNEGGTATQQVGVTVVEVLPHAEISADVNIGQAPLDVNFSASGSYDPNGTIVSYEWDWEGDGIYDFNSGTSPDPPTANYSSQGSFDATVRVTDDDGNTATASIPIITSFVAQPDTVYALPERVTAQDGDVVRITVYTNEAANPFQYMIGVRFVVPQGNFYSDFSFNVGEPGGAINDVDGVWADMNPSGGFLLPPDSFITETDIGGGMIGIDFDVIPLGGHDITSATGAMFNFGLEVHTDCPITFERTNVVDRTYYQDSTQTQNYFWSHDDNAGMPGITLIQ